MYCYDFSFYKISSNPSLRNPKFDTFKAVLYWLGFKLRVVDYFETFSEKMKWTKPSSALLIFFFYSGIQEEEQETQEDQEEEEVEKEIKTQRKQRR